jgi:hypothetical protein
LKKQSQCQNGQYNANSFIKGNCDNKPAFGAQKNKAKQSQYYLAPRFIWGLKKQSQFTPKGVEQKPDICPLLKLRTVSIMVFILQNQLHSDILSSRDNRKKPFVTLLLCPFTGW